MPKDGSTPTPVQTPAPTIPAPSATPTHEPIIDGPFDADRAMRTIGTLREAEKTLKAQLAEAAAKALKYDELENAKKSELQKLTEQLEAERIQRTALEGQALRARVALAKGVPAELADRLQGETEDELTADADKLMALVVPDGSAAPRASAHQGASGTPGLANDDPLLRDLKSKLGIA